MATTDWCDSADDWGDDDAGFGDIESSVASFSTSTKDQNVAEVLDQQADRLGKMALDDNCQLGNEGTCGATGDAGSDSTSTGMEGQGCEAVEDCIAESMAIQPVSENLQSVLNVPGTAEQSPSAEPDVSPGKGT